MERRGLKIRNVLSALRLSWPPEIGSMPTMLMHTMKKSRQFQGSLRYANLWKTKPKPMILTTASAIKIMEKTKSIFC